MWKRDKEEAPAERVTMCSPGRSANWVITEDTKGGKRWQYFMLSFGYNSDATMSECKETWPMQAIKEARSRLDELEKFLAEDAKATVANRDTEPGQIIDTEA